MDKLTKLSKDRRTGEGEGEGTSPFARSARLARSPPRKQTTETERPTTPQPAGEGASHQGELPADRGSMKMATQEEGEWNRGQIPHYYKTTDESRKSSKDRRIGEREGEGTSPCAGSAWLARPPPKKQTTETERPATPQSAGEGTSHQGELPADRGSMKRATQEEGEWMKCRNILVAMKAAIKRQPNISTDVKNGIVKLEEAIETIASLRANENPAEKTWRCQAIQTEEAVPLKIPAPVGQATQTEKAAPLVIPAPASKRAASSPAKPEGKKRKTEGEPAGPAVTGQWTKVQRKKKKKKKRGEEEQQQGAEATKTNTEPPKQEVKGRSAIPKNRRAAISIRPASGRTYAGVLSAIKAKVRPEETGTEIKAIRETRAGDVLLELGANAGDTGGLMKALAIALGDSGVAKSLVPRCTIEIRDVDCVTSEEEIAGALRKEVEDLGDVKVNLTRPNPKSQRAAIVELPEKVARTILKLGRLKVGWVSCRVRLRTEVQRCFKCLNYGHIAGACRGPDRSRLCYRCGQEGHVAKACKGKENCVLCAEAGVGEADRAHTPGTGRCNIFREALKKAKTKAR